MKPKFVKIFFTSSLIFGPLPILISCTQSTKIKLDDSKEIVDKIVKNFALKHKTSHENFYPTWKKNDKVTVEELGIKRQKIKEKVDIIYQIDNLNLDDGIVKVKVKIRHGEYSNNNIIIEITNFKTKNQNDVDKVLNLLQNVKTKKEKTLPSHIDWVCDKVNANALGINWPLDEKLNGVQIKIIDKKINDVDGKITLDLEVSKGKVVKNKQIIIDNFINQKKLLDNIQAYIASFTIDNPLNLNGQISVRNKWSDLLEKFVEGFDKQFGYKVSQMVQWNINDFDNQMWGTKNLHQISRKEISFKFKNQANNFEYQSEWENIYLTNIKYTKEEQNIYQIKSQFEKLLSGSGGIKKSSFFETKKVHQLFVELGNKNLSVDELEHKLGIEFPDDIKNSVKVTGKVMGTSNKLADSDIIIVKLSIAIGDLEIVISDDLWVSFAKE